MNKKFLTIFALATVFSAAQAMENQPQQKNTDSTFFIGGFPTQQPNYLENCTFKLPQRPDVNKTFDELMSKKLSRLHQAAKRGNTESCVQLLASNANINALNSAKQTPLCCAAVYGHLEIVKLLLANNAALNISSDTNLLETIAESCTNKDIYKLLIGSKATMECACVFKAVMGGHKDTIKLLLEHGAPATKPFYTYTPIYIAANVFYNRQNESLCRLLILYGANDQDINLNGELLKYVQDCMQKCIQECDRKYAQEVHNQRTQQILILVPVSSLVDIIIGYADLSVVDGLARDIAHNKAQAALNYKRLCESSEAQKFQQMQEPTQTTSSTSPADSEIKNDENGIPVPAGELPAAVSALQKQIKEEDTNNAQNLDNNLD